jgi:hypothetical protein
MSAEKDDTEVIEIKGVFGSVLLIIETLFITLLATMTLMVWLVIGFTLWVPYFVGVNILMLVANMILLAGQKQMVITIVHIRNVLRVLPYGCALIIRSAQEVIDKKEIPTAQFAGKKIIDAVDEAFVSSKKDESNEESKEKKTDGPWAYVLGIIFIQIGGFLWLLTCWMAIRSMFGF